MTRDEMRIWTRPEIAGAVVWRVSYLWGSLGCRRTIHGASLIEGVVRSFADDQQCRDFSVTPIGADGSPVGQ